MGPLTRTRARVVLTVLKTCFAEEVSTVSSSKISMDTLALYASVAIFTGLVWDVLVGRRWLSSGDAAVGWEVYMRPTRTLMSAIRAVIE